MTHRSLHPFRFGVSLALLLVACSSARYSTEPGAPTLVLPARVAEGSVQPQQVTSAPPPAVASSASATPVAPAFAPSAAPDPTPLRMAEQVEYELELAEGKVRLVSVRPIKLSAPIVTPRRLGRYAIELGIGQELIERVRFDFPGTAADEPTLGAKKSLREPLDLGSRAIARVKLLLPHSPRVRRVLLVDRARSTAHELEWPLPVVPRVAPAPAPSPSSTPAQL